MLNAQSRKDNETKSISTLEALKSLKQDLSDSWRMTSWLSDSGLGFGVEGVVLSPGLKKGGRIT